MFVLLLALGGVAFFELLQPLCSENATFALAQLHLNDFSIIEDVLERSQVPVSPFRNSKRHFAESPNRFASAQTCTGVVFNLP